MSKTANITEFLNSRKVELASEAVELGVIDDIASMTTKARDMAKQLGDAVDSADRLKAEFDKQVTLVKKLYPQASKFQEAEDKLWDKATKAAADLGLKREDIKGWKEFSDAGLNVNSAINGANKYNS
jgi:ClpP class serine protease